MPTEHEFQQQGWGADLPDTLYSGPPPYAGRADAAGGGGSGGRAEERGGAGLLAEPWASIVRAAQRKGSLTPIYSEIGTAPVRVRPMEERLYLIVQNTSIANTIYIGVGYPPTAVTGLILAPNGGAYEPSVCPPQEIWLLASAASTPFVLLYCNG